MIGFMEGTEGNAVGIRVSGEVETDDFRALGGLLEEAIERHGKINLLIEIERLGGVEPGVLWEEVKFAASHMKEIQRIALVGDALWQEGYVRVMGPLVPAEMKHFSSDSVDEAWHWVRH